MKKCQKKVPVKAYIVLAFIGYGFYLTIFHDNHTFWDGGIKLFIFAFASSISIVPLIIFLLNIVKGRGIKESANSVKKYFVTLKNFLIDGANNIDK